MKTNKVLAFILAVLMLLSAVPFAVYAEDVPAVTNLRINKDENGVCDGAFELLWTMLDDMSRMKVSGAKVMYSTDQTNWKLAYETSDRYASNAYIKSFEDGGQPASGTTYYFYACYIGKNGTDGPKSSVVSAKYSNSAADLRADWDAVVAGYKSKTTETGTKYNKVNFVKGEKIVWDNGLYTLTVLVSAISKNTATLNISMKNKTGATYECHYIDWKGATNASGGMGISVHEGTLKVNLDLSKLDDGANYLSFAVTAWGNPISKYSSVAPAGEFREYSENLLYIGRKHTLYLQKAPDTPYITFIGENPKVTSTALSFGSAYKSRSESVKSSGTILYYKASNAKKWSKKAFAAGKPLKLTKLQPNTEYSLRTVNFVKSISAADNKTVITSTSGYSNILKVRTGIATAPDIKSIKVASKVVKIHHNAEWWYNGVKWIYKEAYDSIQTNYTVTVTLKSAAKGMVALQCSGLGALKTEITDGKGTTFKFTGNKAGNAKGKSITLSFLSYTNKINNSVYVGTSPSVKKSVKL